MGEDCRKRLRENKVMVFRSCRRITLAAVIAVAAAAAALILAVILTCAAPAHGGIAAEQMVPEGAQGGGGSAAPAVGRHRYARAVCRHLPDSQRRQCAVGIGPGAKHLQVHRDRVAAPADPAGRPGQHPPGLQRRDGGRHLEDGPCVARRNRAHQRPGPATHPLGYGSHGPLPPGRGAVAHYAVRAFVGAGVGGETRGRDPDLFANVGSLRSGGGADLAERDDVALWPAGQQELAPFQARSGYRVRVALPADMADGRFAESLDFAARPAGAAEGPRGWNCKFRAAWMGGWRSSAPRSTATASCDWASCKRETACTRPWS